MRKAIVAGQFYYAEKTALNKQIESCFLHKLGPGTLPRAFLQQKKKIGMIVPHAGYQFSGPCACHAYKALVEVNKKDLPETFLLLGPNHTGYARTAFSLSLENFETPLGLAENNSELAKGLIEAASSFGLQQDEIAHRFEHSLEVQLPFLQFCYNLVKANFNIVPIVVSSVDYDSCIKLAKAIAPLLKEKKVCVIASSDFTHYGPAYGFLPFTKNIKQNLYALDKQAISCILKLNSQEFYKKAMNTTICGYAPIIIGIEIAKKLGAQKASLLKYYTSGDITNDYSNAVGYASIAFE